MNVVRIELGCFAIIVFDNAAKLFTTFDLTFERRREFGVENVVSDIFSPMWPPRIVVANPGRVDVV